MQTIQSCLVCLISRIVCWYYKTLPQHAKAPTFFRNNIAALILLFEIILFAKYYYSFEIILLHFRAVVKISQHEKIFIYLLNYSYILKCQSERLDDAFCFLVKPSSGKCCCILLVLLLVQLIWFPSWNGC